MSGSADEAREDVGFSGCEAVLDVLDDGVCQLDADGTVIAANDAFEELVGRARTDLRGTHLADVVEEADPEGDVPDLRERLTSALGEGATMEATVTPAEDGRRCELRLRPLDGTDDGAVAVLEERDATSPAGDEDEATERQFRSLVAEVRDYAIFLLDPDGHVASWNRGAARIKGYEKDEILGEHVSTFYTEEDRDAGIPERNLETAREDGRVVDEGWRVRKDDSRFYANVVLTRLRGEDGTVEGFVKVTQDVTDRREREQQVRQERDVTEQILDTIPVSVGVIGPDTSFERLNSQAADQLGADEFDEGYVIGDRDVYDADGEFVPPDERPYAMTLETGEPVRDWECQIDLPDGGRRWTSINADPISDEDGEVQRVVVCAQDITRLKEQERRLKRQRDELESELEGVFERVDDAFFALDEDWRFTYVNGQAEELLDRSQGELIGQPIWDAFPEIEGSTFQEEFERAMETNHSVSFDEFFAPLSSWFEVTAYPSESGLSVYFRDVTDRKERERELARFEKLFEESKDLNAIVDPEGSFRYVTPSVTNVLGYEQDELVGEDAFEYMHPEDREDIWAAFAATVEDPEYAPTVEFRFEHSDGHWVTLEAHGRNLLDDPQIEGIVAYTRDITERKRRERELERYETIVSTIEDGVYVLDEDFCFTKVNDAYVEMTGYDREELLGTHCSLVVDDDVWEESADQLEEIIADQASGGVIEADINRADGTTLRAESRFTAVPGGDDVHQKVGVVRDISERKARERALKERERRLSTLMDNVPGMVYRCQNQEGWPMEFVSDGCRELTGYEPEALEDGDVSYGADIVYEEDRDQLRKDVQEGLDDDGSFLVTYRIVTPDDEVRWVRERGREVVDQESGSTALEGVIIDVTERMEYEQALEKSERRYRTLAEQFPSGAVGMYDEDLRYTLVEGQIWEELDDVSADDLEGERVPAVLPAETANDLVPVMRDALDGEIRRVETEFLGRTFQVWATPLRDEDGEIFAGISFSVDITDRKEYERELERYERIVEAVDDGVYVVDEDGHFTMVNRAYGEMTGYDREELVGEHVSLVVDQETGESAQDLERELETAERETASLEADIVTADGERVSAEASFALLDGEDAHQRIGVVRDITERKRYEETLRALHASARDLLGAETSQSVDEVVLEATIDTLEMPGAVVFRHDAERDQLVPVAEHLEPGLVPGDVEPIDVEDESFMAQTFREGESRRFDNLLEATDEDVPDEIDLRAGLFVPIGTHGVVAVGSREVGSIDDRTVQLLELLGANAATAYESVERERELRRHASQQEAVARLGRQALQTRDLDALFEEATTLVSEVLATNFCKVLDLHPEREELLLRAGVGWKDGYVGEATVGTGVDSQAGFTLQSDEPVVVRDIATESRFSGPDLLLEHDVQSGISVVIGAVDDPWGVLGTHDTAVREYADNDVNFVNSVATILATAIERDRRERQIERHRDQLTSVVRFDQVTQSINEAVLEASSGEEIERTVCEQLVDSELYRAAWFGTVDLAEGRIAPTAAAGIDVDDLEPVPFADQGAATDSATAAAAGEMTMAVETDEPGVPGLEDDPVDAEAVAAVPTTFEDVRYGVLTVYTERTSAFDEYEQTMASRLGRFVGHAMNALDRKVALQSENRIEIEARLPDVLAGWDAPEAEYSITVDGTIGTDEGTVVQYVTTTGVSTDEAVAAFEALPGTDFVREIGDDEDRRRFEVTYADPPVTATLASVGGRVADVRFDGVDQVIRGELPQSVDNRRIVERLRSEFDALEVNVRRTVTGDPETDTPDGASLTPLTDRQRTALHLAYSGGFFAWPRDLTGEELADSMDVAPATFHQHLRTAQRKVLGTLFDAERN